MWLSPDANPHSAGEVENQYPAHCQPPRFQPNQIGVSHKILRLRNSHKFCETTYARVAELVLGVPPPAHPGEVDQPRGVTGLSRQLAAIPSAALAQRKEKPPDVRHPAERQVSNAAIIALSVIGRQRNKDSKQR